MYYQTSQVLKAQQTISETKSLCFVLRLCLLCLQCIHRPNRTLQTLYCHICMYTAAHRRPSATKKTKPEILGRNKTWREKGPEFCFWATN